MTNRQMIRSDRVPEELWTEVCNTEEEVKTKNIPKKKKCKMAKWLWTKKQLSGPHMDIED